MNKKYIFILSLLFMISFSTGVFAQIISPEHVSFSSEGMSFWHVFFSGIKSDFVTLLVAIISLAASIYLTPCIFIFMAGFMICKMFALGFSAAYLLAMVPHGFPILCAALLPSCLLRIPAYIGLLCCSFALVKERRCRTRLSWQSFGLCSAALLSASLIEAALFQLIDLP